MIRLKEKKQKQGIRLFKNPTDSVIYSIMEGNKGDIWVDDEKKPSMAFAFDGIYAYLDGDTTMDFIHEAVQKAYEMKATDSVIFIPQNRKTELNFDQIVFNGETGRVEKRKRYVMSEPEQGHDIKMLEKYVNELPDGMRIRELDETYFNKINNDRKLEYLTESYRSYEEYQKSGIAYLITEKGEVAAGAIAYSSYSKGIEIQIMTNPEYRGQGLATIVTARLLMYCAENQLRAIWDAANLTSVSVAKKLGYQLEREYYSYKFIF